MALVARCRADTQPGAKQERQQTRGHAAETRARADRFRQPVSLDHFIGGGEQRWRNNEAERLGGLEIKQQLELGWLQYGKIARLFAFNIHAT